MRSALAPPRFEQLAAALLLGAAAALFLTNLGNHYLWQDEAQTALISRTILSEGIPKGTDGRNYFSQELGVEYGEDYVWRWHTWLSFYAVAASYRLFGVDTFAARLPFALFGIATVGLTYAAGLTLWKDRRAALASALLLALSVPFLLLSRQCRYYSAAAFFSLWALHAYARMGDGRRSPSWELFFSSTLLFHTHYIYCATLLASLLLHALLLERRRLRGLCIVGAGVVLVSLPWILWLSQIRLGEDYAARLSDPGDSLRIAGSLLRLALTHLFDPRFLLIPVGLAAWGWARRRSVPAVSARSRRNVALIAFFCAVNLAVLGFTAPRVYFRYLAPVVPALALLTGLLVGALLRHSRALGAAVLALWVATGNLSDFLYELTHDYDGPIEGIAKFLNEYGDEDDTVVITYGDLPLKFYTPMRVRGGLTGEEIPEDPPPDWIILRRFNTGGKVQDEIRRQMAPYVASSAYRLHVIDYPDTPFQNRESPLMHKFRTVRNAERVRIYGRKG